MTATLGGLATIRARNIEQTVSKEFDALQDVHSAVWSLSMALNCACGLWTDLVSLAFIASVTYSFILLQSGMNQVQVNN